MNCPKCGSDQVVNFGKVPTVNAGKRQRCRCQICGKTFYESSDNSGNKQKGNEQ